MATTALYFSPNGTTKQGATALARGLDPSALLVDLTPLSARETLREFSPTDLVLLAMPVYYGRVDYISDSFFGGLSGGGATAVLVATYGNRAFEDALVELYDLATQAGFVVGAAVTLSAQHCMTEGIATGRPDSEDLDQIAAFAEQLKNQLQKGSLRLGEALPGDLPYRDSTPLPLTPLPTDRCTQCGTCAAICPVEAIDHGDVSVVDLERCILCMACIHQCPEEARTIESEGFHKRMDGLRAMTQERKEPQLFV